MWRPHLVRSGGVTRIEAPEGRQAQPVLELVDGVEHEAVIDGCCDLLRRRGAGFHTGDEHAHT